MELEQIRQWLRDRGWCQAYADGYFHSTIGNCSPGTVESERRQGWEFVAAFSSSDFTVIDPSQTPNLTVFRKPAPSFFAAENPWKDKGDFPWLPDLTNGVSGELADYLTSAGGHGSPALARRFQCRCGMDRFIVIHDESEGRVEAACPRCQKHTLIIACNDYVDRQMPAEPSPTSLARHHCQCGNELVLLSIGIEYPVDTQGGWDFSWITAVASCQACNESTHLFDFETA